MSMGTWQYGSFGRRLFFGTRHRILYEHAHALLAVTSLLHCISSAWKVGTICYNDRPVPLLQVYWNECSLRFLTFAAPNATWNEFSINEYLQLEGHCFICLGTELTKTSNCNTGVIYEVNLEDSSEEIIWPIISLAGIRKACWVLNNVARVLPRMGNIVGYNVAAMCPVLPGPRTLATRMLRTSQVHP